MTLAQVEDAPEEERLSRSKRKLLRRRQGRPPKYLLRRYPLLVLVTYTGISMYANYRDATGPDDIRFVACLAPLTAAVVWHLVTRIGPDVLLDEPTFWNVMSVVCGLAIFGGTTYASWNALAELGAEAGMVPWTLPFVVDGACWVAALELLSLRRRRQKTSRGVGLPWERVKAPKFRVPSKRADLFPEAEHAAMLEAMRDAEAPSGPTSAQPRPAGVPLRNSETHPASGGITDGARAPGSYVGTGPEVGATDAEQRVSLKLVSTTGADRGWNPVAKQAVAERRNVGDKQARNILGRAYLRGARYLDELEEAEATG